MNITWHDRVYRFDPTEITVKEAAAIREFSGWNFSAWDTALREYDDRALTALMWVIRKHNGEQVDIAAVDFPMAQFIKAYEEALVAEAKKAKAAAPKARALTAPSARRANSNAARTGSRTRTSGKSAAGT